MGRQGREKGGLDVTREKLSKLRLPSLIYIHIYIYITIIRRLNFFWKFKSVAESTQERKRVYH